MSKLGPESSPTPEITRETAVARIDAGQQRIREARAAAKAEAQAVVDQLNELVKGKHLLISGRIVEVLGGSTITYDSDGRPEHHEVRERDRPSLRGTPINNARAKNLWFSVYEEGPWAGNINVYWTAEEVVTDDFAGECVGLLTDLSWEEAPEDSTQGEEITEQPDY